MNLELHRSHLLVPSRSTDHHQSRTPWYVFCRRRDSCLFSCEVPAGMLLIECIQLNCSVLRGIGRLLLCDTSGRFCQFFPQSLHALV